MSYKPGDDVIFRSGEEWRFGVVAADRGPESAEGPNEVDIVFLVNCPSGIKQWKTTVKRVNVYKVDPEDMEFYPWLGTDALADVASWRASRGLSPLPEAA